MKLKCIFYVAFTLAFTSCMHEKISAQNSNDKKASVKNDPYLYKKKRDSVNENIFFYHIDSVRDKSIVASIENLTKSISEKEKDKESDYTAWIGLISAIIGGFLVILGQYFVERFKYSQEKRKELSNALSEIVRQKNMLQNLYRELAMYRIHSEYWWFCAITESPAAKQEEYRKEHLRSQAEARKVAREIGEATSIFLGLLAKFEALFGKTLNLNTQLNKISNLIFRKAKGYPETLDYDDVKNNLVEPDEKNLRDEYFKNLQPFDQIIDLLKRLIK